MDAAEELLKRIRELEDAQSELKREVSELLTTTEPRGGGGSPQCQLDSSCRREVSLSSKQQQRLVAPERRGGQWQRSSCSSRRRRLPPPLAGRSSLSHRHHAMVMQSLGQAVHVLDLQGKVLYWNRYAEHLYGYSTSEAIGRDVTELLVHLDDIGPATNIIGSIFTGKCWRGKFPVKNKSGERFSIVTIGTPLYEDDGTMIGLVCLSEDTRTLQEIIGLSTTSGYYY